MRLLQAALRLFGVAIAVVLAVASGVSAIILLGEILPHGNKSWLLSFMFFAGVGIAVCVGVGVLRIAKASKSRKPLFAQKDISEV